MKYPILDVILDGRLAFVGIAGSGKTTAAKGGVERLLAAEKRVCIVDLLDGWWGLRLSKDGKRDAFPVIIFGGRHADLPLTETSGALIGKAVAEASQSTIVCLSELDGDAARRRFAKDFFDALHKNNRGALHLIIDEADFYAPQNPVKEGPGPLLLNRIKEITARGRMRGFRSWLITQRPAKLHKDALTQADTMVALQLTHPRDRKAIDEWISDQTDKAIGANLIASLPSLKQGDAVLWSPRNGVLQLVHFPLPDTYDASSTPDHDDPRSTVALKPINLGAIKDRMAAIETQTKANDPAVLKKRIAELERAAKNGVDPGAAREAEERGVARGKQLGASAGAGAIKRVLAHAKGLLKTTIADAAEDLASHLSLIQHELDGLGEAKPVEPARSPIARKATAGGQGNARVSPARANDASGGATLSKPHQKVLSALMFWRELGFDAPSREQVAAAAGYSPSSGGFANLLGTLRTAGLIDYPGTGTIRITNSGLAAAPEEQDNRSVRERVNSILNNPQIKILDALPVDASISRTDLGIATGYSPTSGGFANILGSLRTLGVIDYPATGQVKASDWLFL